MNPLAKLKRKWHVKLRARMTEIVWCELCGVQTGPGGDLAHRRKQRFILTEEEYMMACRLCRACHQGLDENWNKQGISGFNPHEVMFETITELIEKR